MFLDATTTPPVIVHDSYALLALLISAGSTLLTTVLTQIYQAWQAGRTRKWAMEDAEQARKLATDAALSAKQAVITATKDATDSAAAVTRIATKAADAAEQHGKVLDHLSVVQTASDMAQKNSELLEKNHLENKE